MGFMVKKKQSTTLDLSTANARQSYRSTKTEPEVSLTLRYESLARWASEYWQQQHPGKSFLVLWASENCGNNLARQRVKPGRKLKGKARYGGYQPVDCPMVMPISDYRLPGRGAGLAEPVVAFQCAFTGGYALTAPFYLFYFHCHYRGE